MQRLIVDMDGVLADVYSQFIVFEERATGKKLSMNDVAGKSELEAFTHAREYVRTPGFFRTAPVVKGSQETLQKLNDRYEIFIVSAATEFPRSFNEKMEWLEENFSFIKWQQIVFCGSKRIVTGDIMIDDHFKNLDFFKGRTLLFTQPHNQNEDSKWHERVSTWEEISHVLG
ncbi:MAG TPA: 5'(3')-deoxyribonucleotidase [Verrucomicrobiae bacterium]|jgi:5'(3')-deoxyribonucleotidase|nr:5'(3')-deoxyribonucleotidase [Verrucomicrobiae bacterium]